MADFTRTRALFHIPDGVTYLDGNSLGPMPLSAEARATAVIRDQWSEKLIRGWNEAGWYAQPRQVGDRVARLIGAGAGEVVMGDTLTIKVFQAVSAALKLAPNGARVILSDSGNFPSDLYTAAGLARATGAELRVVDPQEVEASIGDEIGVLMLTEVDYRTGRRHDMAALTAAAHRVGAIAVWDLAHSAGAVEIDLTGADADFAVGCTYKYLNGGPGSPGFIWVNPRHADAQPILQGWLGHDAPFAFDPDYRPAGGVERMRVGTPPVIALSVLDAALDAFDGVTMAEVAARSIVLTERFIAGVEAACGSEVALNGPRDPARRGSQVGFRHPEAYAVMQALIAAGVIGDFRAPDVLRFGFTPLYIGEAEVDRAVAVLAEVLATRAWDAPRFRQRGAVT